jgi:hypothetical protein
MTKNISSDLKQAYDRITSKVTLYTKEYSYLDGNPALVYSTDRLARAFGKSFVYFAMNWAAVIINAVLDRLVLKGFDSGNEAINTKINELFYKMNLNLDAQDVHEAVEVTGEGFLIVDTVDNELDVYFNDPRMVEVVYDSARPKIKRFAAKKWTDDLDIHHIDLYYTDRTEHYVSESGNSAGAYRLVETTPNVTGIIPVFHFRNSRRIRKGEFGASEYSELDAINKLFGDMMVAAEFEVFKTRVFISQADPGDTKISPDMKIWIPANETPGAQDSSVIELGGNNLLTNFIDPIIKLAGALAVQTRTPKTFFMNSGANLSGEALLVEEAPLVKKVNLKRQALDPTWREFISYVLLLDGTKIDASQLKTIWEPIETTQPLTNSIIVQNEVNAGVPLSSALRRRGSSEEDITQIESDKQSVTV